MQLNERTLQKLREIINSDDNEIHYRSGPMLVKLFNSLGYNDVYASGFPSRKDYTDKKLMGINNTPKLDECIKKVFSVENYVDDIEELDHRISDFNKYLKFNKWQIVRDNATIILKQIDKVVVPDSTENKVTSTEESFLRLTFDVNVRALKLDSEICNVIEQRLHEIESCINNGAPLASIFLIGSTLEGILSGIMSTFPKQFNQAQSAPKNSSTGKTKPFQEWTLNNMIDASAEIGILKQDVKKFSHVVREFRNYIHPYQQLVSHFSPDKHTAMICLQVLKAAIHEISEYRKTAETR